MKKFFLALALLAMTSFAFAGCLGETDDDAVVEDDVVVEEDDTMEPVVEDETMEEVVEGDAVVEDDTAEDAAL